MDSLYESGVTGVRSDRRDEIGETASNIGLTTQQVKVTSFSGRRSNVNPDGHCLLTVGLAQCTFLSYSYSTKSSETEFCKIK